MNQAIRLRGLFACAVTLAACSGHVDEQEDRQGNFEPWKEVDDSTKAAMLVVDGEIVDTKTFDSDEVGMFTLARLRVDHLVEGHGTVEGEEIILQVRGGRIGDDVTVVSETPFLEVGQRARFYLDPLLQVDQQAIDGNAKATSWAGDTALAIRHGMEGMVGLRPSGGSGVGVAQQALDNGGPGESFYFGYTTPYDLTGNGYRYYVNPNTNDTIAAEYGVQMGFKAWEAVPGARVMFDYRGTTTSTQMRSDTYNVVHWRSGYLDYYKTAETSVYSTYNRNTGKSEVKGFDLVFNDDYQWNLYEDHIIGHTAMHEAGHALGFRHVSDTGQIMYGNYQPTVRLGQGDRAGAREWYRGPYTTTIGDFNGDGRDDIITLENRNATGDVWVALNQTDRFGTASSWLAGGAVPGTIPLTGRFNNDSRDDLALLFETPSHYAAVVCTSTGSRFSNCNWWSVDFPDSITYEVGDVNGDGLDDLVGFTQGVTGHVHVALSNGSGFGAPQLWYPYWFALGDSTPKLGDVDGDGDDDLILFQQSSNGTYGVHVAKSNRSSFDGMFVAATSLCSGADKPLVGDLNDDSRADIACVSGTYMSWMAGQPNGTFSGRASALYTPEHNRSTFIGRFPTQGSVVSFDHCEGADVYVSRRNVSADTWDSATIWHTYFAPGPPPCN